MKINSNTHHGAIHLPSLTHSFEAIRSSLGHFGSKLLKGTSDLGTQLQIGRMQSVLHAMTDEQLEMIDLKRSDIRRRAEFLINGEAKAPVIREYDGL